MRAVLLLLSLLLAPAARADEALLAALRAGSTVIFMRHAETGPPWPDHAGAVLGDCASQRDLTEAGRAQAEAMGEAIRDLGIPIGTVLASPFCRTMETAVLAFGTATPTASLGLPPKLDATAHAGMGQALLDLVAKAARGDAPGNLVLVGHSYHLMAAGGPRPDPQGATAILRPRPGGGFDTLALLPPDGWRRLAHPQTAEAR
jgi:phosphohistidine phosphatase SixA